MLPSSIRLSWIKVSKGNLVKKLNTHTVYDLALRVHPLTEISHTDGMTLKDAIWTLLMARTALLWLGGGDSFFSTSLKRSADSLLDTVHGMGVPRILPWEAEGGEPYNPELVVESWRVSNLNEAAKSFETVLANELPGLATYFVLQKGIYSTDDLLTQADHQLSESVRAALPKKASQDICEAGKCLAFELATASAFHIWRALETVMDAYHEALTGKPFPQEGPTRNWGVYIKALKSASAEIKITSFLDHIREEYRNPISHPSDTVGPQEAVDLFSAGLSAIGQAMRATITERNKKAIALALGGADEKSITAAAGATATGSST